MQRIEADTVGAQAMREFDQAREVREIADPPIARRADAVKLDRDEPATVEITAKGLFGHDKQRHILGGRGGIDQLQPVDAQWQILRPNDNATGGLAFGDNLKRRNDFPPYR